MIPPEKLIRKLQNPVRLVRRRMPPQKILRESKIARRLHSSGIHNAGCSERGQDIFVVSSHRIGHAADGTAAETLQIAAVLKNLRQHNIFRTAVEKRMSQRVNRDFMPCIKIFDLMSGNAPALLVQHQPGIQMKGRLEIVLVEDLNQTAVGNVAVIVAERKSFLFPLRPAVADTFEHVTILFLSVRVHR